ncbi:MAG: metallophosphoesterase [Planctomycetota bacterium]|nr:metallophosphoesterase [Planctomycetota bacterium]
MLRTLVTVVSCSWLVLASPAFARAHDPETQILELSVALLKQPSAAKLYLKRADCYLLVDEPRLALADFESAVLLAPNNITAALGRAGVLQRLGRFEEALTSIDRAIALGADGCETAWMRGRLLVNLGDHERALRMFARAMPRLSPRCPEHYLEMAAALVASGESERRAAALSLIDRGMAELGPAVCLVHTAVELAMEAGDVDGAIARLDRLARYADNQAPWHKRRAELLQRAGRSEEAAAEWAAMVAARDSVEAERSRPSKPLAALPQTAPSTQLVSQPVAEQALVPAGSVWRYKDDNSITGTAWRMPGYDDSGWSQGPGQFGYGEGDEATVLNWGTNPSNRHITSWFRHVFTLPPQANYTTVRLRVLRDDGVVLYVNGTEVGSDNMGLDPVTETTLARNNINGAAEHEWLHFTFDPALMVPGDNVLAAEIHQESPYSGDMSFDCELLAGNEQATILRGPYLQNGTSSSAVLRWRTDYATDSQVWIGPAPGQLQLVHSDPVAVANHQVELQALSAETRYYYAVGNSHGLMFGNDADHWFETLPPVGADRPVRIWTLGDSGHANPEAEAVRDSFLQFTQGESPDMLLMLGDNAYPNGTDPEYQAAFFDMYPTVLRNTFSWSTFGNHDYRSARSVTESGVYYDIFNHPRAGEAGGLPSGTEAYYSFDRGHVHFICIDSMGSPRTVNGPMMQWLRADLASTTARWTIVYMHHPPYSKGSHDSDSRTDSSGRLFRMREVFVPELEAAGVDLVLSGHSHSYERSCLVDGHYGESWTLQPSMVLDSGDGRVDGDGAYLKPTAGRTPNEGAVYVVSGSASEAGPGTFDHPIMVVGFSQTGSLVLDIDGDRLDGTFVTGAGTVGDRFTIEKGVHRPLTRDVPALSVTAGGAQTFEIDAGVENAGRAMVLAGSFGSSPGFAIQGIHVPLNPDPWLIGSLHVANGSMYPGSSGILDSNGKATAAFVLPPGIGAPLLGMSLFHAYVVVEQSVVHMASNPVRVRFLP